MADPAWREDARRAHGAPLGEWPGRCGVARGASEGHARELPGSRHTSAARAREAPDEIVRRDALVRAEGRGSRRGALGRPHEDLRGLGTNGWIRVSDRGPVPLSARTASCYAA